MRRPSGQDESSGQGLLNTSRMTSKGLASKRLPSLLSRSKAVVSRQWDQCSDLITNGYSCLLSYQEAA